MGEVFTLFARELWTRQEVDGNGRGRGPSRERQLIGQLAV